MRLRVILGDVLPVCGTVGLLGLWLFQQVGIEQRAGELRKIASARTDYQTYQSHNAVFNAVNEVVPNSGASERVRIFQTYNYELGLAAIEKVLPTDLKKDIPPPINAYDGTSFAKKMERAQERLQVLQGRLDEYEQSVRHTADRDRRTYLMLYLGISAMSILGAVLKVLDKLGQQASLSRPTVGTVPGGHRPHARALRGVGA
jgi:hypothetical protein